MRSARCGRSELDYGVLGEPPATSAPPGSAERIATYEWRLAAGFEIHSDQDTKVFPVVRDEDLDRLIGRIWRLL